MDPPDSGGLRHRFAEKLLEISEEASSLLDTFGIFDEFPVVERWKGDSVIDKDSLDSLSRTSYLMERAL